jgi:hypothetical protein
MRDRFAVKLPNGLFAGPSVGHDWRTNAPSYNHVDLDHARLYFQKAGATRCANHTGGTVMRAKIVLEEV